LLPYVCAVGVGSNDPEPVSSMGSSDGCSRNNKRPRGVAETFQVSEHIVECHCDETSNVFANDPSGSRECNDAAHFRPEVAVVLFAFLLACDAEGLTRETTTDEIDSSKPTQSVCVNGVDIVEAGDIGPVLPQDGSAVLVALAEGDGSHPGSFESDTESTNSAEEVEDIHHLLNGWFDCCSHLCNARLVVLVQLLPVRTLTL
jgi:hypothetical protein